MHRLSLKIASGTAFGSFILLLLPTGAADAAVAAVVSGAIAYLVTWRLTKRRLDTVSRLLQAIRQQRFDPISNESTAEEDELDKALQSLHETARSVEREMLEMRRLENHRRDFLGNVSHELKTPIFAVQGFAETLLDGALEDENVRRSFVEKILRNATRLSNLARDLSEISRIETGELRLSIRPFRLHRLIREVVESLEVRAREREVALAPSVPERLPPALADPEAIRQVLINLVDNGIKYNNPGGRVEIFARQVDDRRLRVSVVDNGIGIDTADVPRVTERFFRVDKSRSRSQGGTGLGLAIVKHLLAVHDQKLLIESMPGQGSSFGFVLPIASEVPAADAESVMVKHAADRVTAADERPSSSS